MVDVAGDSRGVVPNARLRVFFRHRFGDQLCQLSHCRITDQRVRVLIFDTDTTDTMATQAGFFVDLLTTGADFSLIADGSTGVHAQQCGASK